MQYYHRMELNPVALRWYSKGKPSWPRYHPRRRLLWFSGIYFHQRNQDSTVHRNCTNVFLKYSLNKVSGRKFRKLCHFPHSPDFWISGNPKFHTRNCLQTKNFFQKFPDVHDLSEFIYFGVKILIVRN